MPDWADVKDLYEVDRDMQPQEPEYTQRIKDPHSLRVEMPGLPGFMKHRGPLRLLSPKKDYMTAIEYAFAQRIDKRGRGWSGVHGGNCTAALSVTVAVIPPRRGLLPRRWKDSLYQSMMVGFVRPSTEINLDYAVLVICRALCKKPLQLVRRRANIARIHAEAVYSDRESVTIELRRDKQYYDIHIR